MKAELLINPRSRGARQVLQEIVGGFEAQGITISHVTRLRKGDKLADILAEIKQRKPKLLIVGGGDGTISHVVDHVANTELVLAILPLGTTNNFARSLNIPLELPAAIEMAATSRARRIDLGNISGDLFTNVAGVGLSARIATTVTNGIKRRFGRAAYVLVGLACFVRHKPFRATIRDINGGLQVHLETHQLIIANGRYHGGKLLASDASVDNRELIIFALGGRSKFSFAKHLLDFYLGRRKKVAHASYMIGRDFEIITDREQPVELDGEVTLMTPLHATIEPKAVRIRYPSAH
jgi:diacylglycerol kinase (ATP)